MLHSYTIPFVLFGSSYSRCFFFFFSKFLPFAYKFYPPPKNFPPSQQSIKRREWGGGEGIGSIELFATSTWLIFEIRRWREERLLVRKGNMCKIIRNCSRRCRLNPISPVSISSHRAGYSPFRRITLPSPPPPPSSLGLTFTPFAPSSVPLALTYSITHRPTTGRGFILRFVQNHRRLTTAALWIFPLVNRLLAGRVHFFHFSASHESRLIPLFCYGCF